MRDDRLLSEQQREELGPVLFAVVCLVVCIVGVFVLGWAFGLLGEGFYWLLGETLGRALQWLFTAIAG